MAQKRFTGKKAQSSKSASGGPARWESGRAQGHSGLSFSLRIMCGFIITALVTVAILVVVLRMEFQGEFYKYTRSNVEQLATITANTLADRYASEGAWNAASVESAVSASTEIADIGVQVLDANGGVIFDGAESVNPVNGHEVKGRLPEEPGSVVEVPIHGAGGTIGTVRVWTFGGDALLTPSDTQFLKNTYIALALASGAAIVLAWLIGAIMARSLARPIMRITTTAQNIRGGNLSARSGVKGTDEIGTLGETFDDMAATLEADLRMEHRLTSDVAHELRTPLMSIIVNVEAMQDGVLPADVEHLELVAGEVRRLSRLVDAMLRLSRIENGSTPLNLEVTDIVGLVSTLVASQEQLFADQGLTLRFRLDGSRTQARATVDRDLIRQAIVNLLSNAMRYTPEGGNVVVAVGIDHDDVVVSVTDTGIGIDKEDLQRVFTRFWRSDASRERDSGGLGVGLSLVREIVGRHGGYVSVDSEEGRGSTFALHLPRYHGWASPS